MNAQTFTLGQTVQFTGTVEKVREHNPSRTVYRPAPLPETVVDFRPEPKTRPNMWDRRHTSHDTGIIVGKRTIADHSIGYLGYDEGSTATAVSGTHRTAWLVAWNLHRKPVLVLTEQIVEATS